MKITLIKRKIIKISSRRCYVLISINTSGDKFNVTLFHRGILCRAKEKKLITAYNSCVGDYYNKIQDDNLDHDDFIIKMGIMMEILTPEFYKAQAFYKEDK